MGCGGSVALDKDNPQVSIPQSNTRYERKQLIGKGTYGRVYKCIDMTTNNEYAMKVIKINSDNRNEAAKQIGQLKLEISMLKKLNHPYIVRYHNFDVTPDLEEVEIVMELVKEGTLKEYIDRHGSLTESVTAEIGSKILNALVYLHSQSIIHRDLKCANVLLSADLVPKLTDFGTAKIIPASDKDDIAKISASLKGTPYYMAPQVLKRTGHNNKADIWSFGCMVIEMLSGKAPWTGLNASFSQIINYISSGVHPPFPPNISKECGFFLQSCLNSIPAERLEAQVLLKHRFIQRHAVPVSNDRNLRSKSRNIGSQINGIELQIEKAEEKLKNGENVSSIQNTIRSNSNNQYGSQMNNYEQTARKMKEKKKNGKPIKKHTTKYLNQMSELERLEIEIGEVSISQQEFPRDNYYVKKTLTNLKKSKQGKQISKTSTTVKMTEQNLKNLSDSRGDFQLRSNTEMSYEENAINTLISRAERDRFAEQQKILQKQRDDEKRKWEQELKEGAQILKKQFSHRYMYSQV